MPQDYNPDPSRYYPNTWKPAPTSPIGRGIRSSIRGMDAITALKDQIPAAIAGGLESLVSAPEPDVDTTMPSPASSPNFLTGEQQNARSAYQFAPTPGQPELNRMAALTQAPEGQVRTQPSYAGGKDVGIMKYGGPRLNTEDAVAGLKNANSTANYSDRGGYEGIPTEELYRHSFGDPEFQAPGAQEWNRDMLKGRLGDEEYNQTVSRKQQEAIMAGLTAQHPAIQAAEEAKALRATYPAQAAGQADIVQAQIAGQSRENVADLAAEADDVDSMRRVEEAAMNNLARIQNVQNPTEEDLARANEWRTILSQIRRKKFDVLGR